MADENKLQVVLELVASQFKAELEAVKSHAGDFQKAWGEVGQALRLIGIGVGLGAFTALVKESMGRALEAQVAFEQMRFAVNQATDSAFPAYQHAIEEGTKATAAYGVVSRNVAESALQILVTNTGNLAASLKA